MTDRKVCHYWAQVVLLSLSFAGVEQQARARTYEVQVPPAEGEKYRAAEFRLWLPAGIDLVRAILVRQHGCGRQGLDHADDLQWQSLASKHQCALLGSHFQQAENCEDWWNPAHGSERAFLVAIKTIAEASDHPELVDVPWALWGHSGGALWSMSMTYRHPDRVVAVFARSGALTEANELARKVPVIFNYGEQEKTGRFERVHQRALEALTANRPLGALWAAAVDPKSSHDCRDSRQLAIPFFDAMLTARLNAPSTETGLAKLRPLDESQAWLGDAEKSEIAATNDYRGEKHQAAWLPNEALARHWQQYVRTGGVADTTPPLPPRSVKVVVLDGAVRLIWSVQADLESGLKMFHIYRDGEAIGSIGGEVTKGNPQGFVQVWNYGDEPEPRLPVPEFVDRKPVPQGRYQISVENHAGLESAKSLPVSAPE